MLASCKKSLSAAFLVICHLALALSARAQSGSSTSITGTVLDPSGAVVPYAGVEIHNPVSGENDDHNPPRIAPRSLFDLSVGHDNLFHGDKYNMERAGDGNQPDEQDRARQLSFDVQRHTLCDAAVDHGAGRI